MKVSHHKTAGTQINCESMAGVDVCQLVFCLLHDETTQRLMDSKLLRHNQGEMLLCFLWAVLRLIFLICFSAISVQVTYTSDKESQGKAFALM